MQSRVPIGCHGDTYFLIPVEHKGRLNLFIPSTFLKSPILSREGNLIWSDTPNQVTLYPLLLHYQGTKCEGSGCGEGIEASFMDESRTEPTYWLFAVFLHLSISPTYQPLL